MRESLKMVLRIFGIVALAGLGVAAPGMGQTLERVSCLENVIIPGGTNPEDKTVDRCNLDSIPELNSSLRSLPTPLYSGRVSGEMTVVVDVDGKVNRKLTRYLQTSGDAHFNRDFLDAVLELRFDSGKRAGRTVRYGYVLAFSTTIRSDSVPERLHWRYIRGISKDSLVGTWQRLDSVLSLTAIEQVEVARSVTRELRDQQILLPEQYSATYCLITYLDAPVDMAEAVRAQLYPSSDHSRAFAPTGCESNVQYRRFNIGRPMRTGGGRTIVHASGDVLSNWPPGLDGRWWRGWEADCVVPEGVSLTAGTKCEVRPVTTGDPRADHWDAFARRAPLDSAAKVELKVIVTTNDSPRLDTIKAAIDSVPKLKDRAKTWNYIPRCTSRTFTARAFWPEAKGIVVFYEDLKEGRYPREILHLTHVAPAKAFGGVDCSGAPGRPSEMAAFTLGGIGEPLKGPVQFCVQEPECAESYWIDPRVHELAARPALRFRLSDIREGARRGSQVHFRVSADRAIANLKGFVVIRTPSPSSIYPLRRQGTNALDFHVLFTEPLPPDAEFWIYLFQTER